MKFAFYCLWIYELQVKYSILNVKFTSMAMDKISLIDSYVDNYTVHRQILPFQLISGVPETLFTVAMLNFHINMAAILGTDLDNTRIKIN